MEDLEHYSKLRKKLSKELHQGSFENQVESRPQTASKQVSFDFSDQMNIRELRNLREKHSIELERLSTPPVPEEPEKKKKKKRKNREKSRKKVKNFEVLYKPANEIEYFEAYEGSLGSSRSSLKGKQVKKPLTNFSSHHSLYSEGSVYSKKSLVEEIEDAYKEAKQALENSFKVDSKVNEAASQKSNSSVNFSRENQEIFEKMSIRSKGNNKEVEETESKRYVKGKNLEYYYQELEKASEYSEKFEVDDQGSEKVEVKKKRSSKRKSKKKSLEDENFGFEERKEIVVEDKVKEREGDQSVGKASQDAKGVNKHSSNPSKHSINPHENSFHSKISNQNLSNHSLEASLHSKTSSKAVPDNVEKFSSHKSHSKIFSKLVEKPLESVLHVDQSINSDIEEEKLREDSIKSSVDFTISDQTPFESLKFSQDPHITFTKAYENLKKGIFYRLLSPIIQNLALENSSDPEKSPKILKKRGLEDFSMHSQKGSVNLNIKENSLLEQSLNNFDIRTSKSQPFENFKYEDSVYEHNETLLLSSNNPQLLENLDINEISIIQHPLPFIDPQLIKEEKALQLLKLVEKAAFYLMADNVYLSFIAIKAKSEHSKEKIEKIKLAEANFEFNILRKVINNWKVEVKNSKFYNSRRFIQYVERWNFVKLYHTFEGLKFVCKAHKQWIFEVRNRLKEHQMAGIFRNWALLIRYRKVKQSIKFRKMKKVLRGWNKVLSYKAELNRRACVHWYLRKNFKSFRSWNEFCLRRKENWVKKVKADKKYYEKIYTKVFLCWKHWKALEQANFIPLRICTKTLLVKKNGNIQEKSLLDIKIIKN
jgi:hypothetical protein